MNLSNLKSRLLALSLIAFVTIAKAQERSAMQAPTVISPEISADNSVTFRVFSPNAESIAVNGSWLNYGESLTLQKDDQGVWSASTEPLASNMYHYNFLIDGVTAIDPANAHALRDGVRYASLLMVPGDQAKVFEMNDTPHGNISKVWYPSPSLNMNRRMYVYTPPGYEAGTDSYPVLYLLHGSGGDEDAWSALRRA
ncbi:MAG: esterase, partial [Algoriphagus sp.]